MQQRAIDADRGCVTAEVRGSGRLHQQRAE
jgi:hypothetical protein